MKFDDALKKMRNEGLMIRRPHWRRNYFLFWNDGIAVSNDDGAIPNMSLSLNDVAADDWTVEAKKKLAELHDFAWALEQIKDGHGVRRLGSEESFYLHNIKDRSPTFAEMATDAWYAIK